MKLEFLTGISVTSPNLGMFAHGERIYVPESLQDALQRYGVTDAASLENLIEYFPHVIEDTLIGDTDQAKHRLCEALWFLCRLASKQTLGAGAPTLCGNPFEAAPNPYIR